MMAILAAGHLLDRRCRSAFGARGPRRRQNAEQDGKRDKGSTPATHLLGIVSLRGMPVK